MESLAHQDVINLLLKLATMLLLARIFAEIAQKFKQPAVVGEILAGIIDSVIAKEKTEAAHPQAFFNKMPNAEELIKEVALLKNKWSEPSLSFEEQNIIKDKLRYVQNRCNWVKNIEHKQYIQSEIENLWQLMLQTI